MSMLVGELYGSSWNVREDNVDTTLKRIKSTSYYD